MTAPITPAGARFPTHRPPGRQQRRALVAAVHETALLLLGAAALWSAARQLQRSDGWDRWAIPLVVAAVIAAGRATLVWVGPPLSLPWRRAATWGALGLATPAALATMTTIDFSALAACQLLLVAGTLAELPAKQRVVAFLWLVPSTVVIALLLYRSSL